MRSGVRPVWRLVLPVCAVLAATSCSSSSTSGGGSSTTAAGTSAASSSAASGSGGQASATVTVTEKEFSLGLSQSQFTPGTYTFVAENKGSVTHALAIAGPGVTSTRTSGIAPGQSARLTVTLQGGSYELWCPIDDHKALGMDTHVQVGGGASPS